MTRVPTQESGTRLEYDHAGAISSQASAPRSVGTTVALKDLFKTLPVRHKVPSACAVILVLLLTPRQDFLRNVKREYGKLLASMQSYALICAGVRLVVTHAAGRAPRATVVHTQGGATLRDNIVTVLGAPAAATLMPFSAQLAPSVRVEGFLSAPTAGAGRSSGDRQFLYVNGRPVDLPRVAKALNEVYRSFNQAQFPAAVLDLQLPPDSYDVNVTPDKRKLLLHDEDALLSALREQLVATWEPSRGTLTVGAAAGPAGKQRRKRAIVDGEEADWASSSDTAGEAEMAPPDESGGTPAKRARATEAHIPLPDDKTAPHGGTLRALHSAPQPRATSAAPKTVPLSAAGDQTLRRFMAPVPVAIVVSTEASFPAASLPASEAAPAPVPAPLEEPFDEPEAAAPSGSHPPRRIHSLPFDMQALRVRLEVK